VYAPSSRDNVVRRQDKPAADRGERPSTGPEREILPVALVNCGIFTGSALLDRMALLVDGRRIVDVISRDAVADDLELVDLHGSLVSPGFVDLQVNGAGGALFNDDTSPVGIKVMAQALARCGTLAFLPTLISAPVAKMNDAVDAVRAAVAQGITSVMGLHFEGPYISASMKGVHDERYLRPLGDEELNSVLLPARDVLRVLTVSPAMVSPEQVDKLVDAGIIVLLGHTDVPYEEAVAYLERGARGVTHLFNAMPPMTRENPGVVAAALATRDAWVSLIADGYHVHPGSILAAKRAKGERLMLVSDAMPPLGCPGCTFVLGSREVACVDGRCATSDGALAGSAVDLSGAVRNCVQTCGISREESLRMASAYPAIFLGESGLGTIAAGARADLVILDPELRVEGIVQDGTVEIW
jgi:N-acetylglucosamine-6-phosphate deacetylase